MSLSFRIFLKLLIQETMPLRSFGNLAASGEEGFRSLGSLPFSEQPKRMLQESLKVYQNQNKQEMGFYKELPFLAEWYQKNGFYRLPTLPLSEDAQMNTPLACAQNPLKALSVLDNGYDICAIELKKGK